MKADTAKAIVDKANKKIIEKREVKKYVRTINIFGKDYPVANLGGHASAEAIKFERDLINKFAD